MRPISNTFINIANQKGRFTLRDDMLNNNVSVYTAPDYGTSSTGKLNDFVTKLNSATGTFNILLEQDSETPNIKGNVINRGRAFIQDDTSISTSAILSDTKSFLVNTDLSNNENVLFFAFEPIELDNADINPDARIYMMTNFDKYDNMDGSFSQGLMTLSRVHQFNLINPDGNNVEVVFTTKGVQPLNVKQVVLNFDSYVALSEVAIIDENNLKKQGQIDSIYDWKINYMYPQKVSEGGTVVWENPWVGQYKYVLEWLIQEGDVVGDGTDDKVYTFTDYVGSSGIGYFKYGNTVNSGNLITVNKKVKNLSPSTDYLIRLNRNGWGVNWDVYQDWYVGSSSYEDEANRTNIQDTDFLANLSNGTGLSLFDINSREFDGSNLGANEPFPSKAPWDDWSGIYTIDIGHLFYRNNRFLENDYFFISEPIRKNIPISEWTTLFNNILNANTPNFNGINFESQIPSPITQLNRDPSPVNWSPLNDNQYMLLIPLKTSNYIGELLTLMNDSAGDNSSWVWNYVTKFMFLKHSGEHKITFKVPQGDSPAMTHNRIPQNAFLSKSFAEQNGWYTDNEIKINLDAETKLNSISINAYGGEYMTLTFLDEDGNYANAQHKDKDGNIIIEPIQPKRYRLIQLTNRLLTKTSITFAI